MIRNASETTVLLVDDDVDFRTQHEALLCGVGFTVVAAESQAQAEELLKARRPDVVILDLMLEHPDGGFALCYHIKKMDVTIPVILVSSVTSETGMEFDASTDEERSWVKADVFLSKPLRFEQLLAEMEKLISRRSPAGALKQV